MATKSIYNNIRIKDPALARSFVHALENAQKKQSPDVYITKKVRDVKDLEEVRRIFGR